MYTYVIIDDEKLTRKGTIKKLDSLSGQISCAGEASNGEEALHLIGDVNPDIIITDMNMPIMDGTKFLAQLIKIYPEKQIIVISGYKDFEYTKQAIIANAVDYILKPFGKKEIQDSVLRAIKMMNRKAAIQKRLAFSEEEREHVYYERDIQSLSNFILGFNESSDDISSQRLKSVAQTHGLILLTLYSQEPINRPLIRNFLLENGFGDLALYLPHLNNNSMAFLILFYPEQAALKPKELCQQVIESLSAKYETQNASILFGISGRHASLSELHDAFEETIQALNSRKLAGTDNFYFYADSAESDAKSLCWDKLDEFLFRVETGMTKQVVELSDDLFSYLASIPLCTVSDVKFYCFHIMEQVKSTILISFDQIKPYSSFSSTEQFVWNNLFCLRKIKEYYVRIFTNISDMSQRDNVYATKDLIDKMKTYVVRNYKKNLTIEFLSSLFYVNRSYCSHLFRKKTGTRFVDYVNAVRIEKSKQLLVESDKKMYQIAKAVGYDNIKYFFRVFNKFEKTTPERYRKNHKAYSNFTDDLEHDIREKNDSG